MANLYAKKPASIENNSTYVTDREKLNAMPFLEAANWETCKHAISFSVYNLLNHQDKLSMLIHYIVSKK